MSPIDKLSTAIARRGFVKGAIGVVAAALGLGAKDQIRARLQPEFRPATDDEIRELLASPGYAEGPETEDGKPLPDHAARAAAAGGGDVAYFRDKILIRNERPGGAGANCQVWAQERRCSWDCACTYHASAPCRLFSYIYCCCPAYGPYWSGGACVSCSGCNTCV